MTISSTIYVVDDDAAVRESLTMLLEAAGYTVSTFQNPEEFLDKCAPECKGCLILDVNMPGMTGPELQEALAKRSIRLPILFLSGHGTIPITVRAIKAGAVDFLTKPVNGALLLERIREALQKNGTGENQRAVNPRLSTLTRREREIMEMAVEGLTSKQIAKHLDISFRTVQIHRAHIMQKTDTANLMELARLIMDVDKD